MPARELPSSDENSQVDDLEQSKRFIDMAREVGVDEDPEAFDRAFKQVTGTTGRTKKASNDQKAAKSQTGC